MVAPLVGDQTAAFVGGAMGLQKLGTPTAAKEITQRPVQGSMNKNGFRIGDVAEKGNKQLLSYSKYLSIPIFQQHFLQGTLRILATHLYFSVIINKNHEKLHNVPFRIQ